MRDIIKGPVARAGLNELNDYVILQQKTGSRTERAERRGALLLRLPLPGYQEKEEAAP
jgi:hypothetical protein